jgi:hypothetical protein
MSPVPPNIEQELSQLSPLVLDDEFLTRLEACAEGVLTELNQAELRFEIELRKNGPAKLPQEFLATLEGIVREVPFPRDEKILLFPKAGSVLSGPNRNRIWSTAAAVALMGALSAFLIPSQKAPLQVTSQSSDPAQAPSTADGRNFVPASFNRGLSEVHDEGVIWKSNNQPQTLVRVVYKDQITLTDANGRTVLVEQPRVEYMLVPARTD